LKKNRSNVIFTSLLVCGGVLLSNVVVQAEDVISSTNEVEKVVQSSADPQVSQDVSTTEPSTIE
jgi:hypothetical protein